MRARNKHPELKRLIEQFNSKGHEKGAWKAVAENINRPRRKRVEVGLDRLEKFAKARETIVVPGVVLAKGELTKPLTIAALKFSAQARAKIESAGGKCIDIAELDEKTISKVRIMG